MKNDLVVDRTPHHDCPACQQKRMHSEEEWEEWHPLMPVDPTALADYQRTMNEEVIPEIRRVVDERRALAAESRDWQLKC